MDAPPQNATMSPDGNYWWDPDINDWKPVPGGAADTQAASSSGDAAAAASTSPTAGGGTATCENGVINGVCIAHDIGTDEIDQALAAAGATLEA